ncbi:MAG: biotin/lipoyl-binding protein [Planctomycetota bacterium]|nr:biotin/lipoyl-binding protein [Planctomycetota bacterium]
MSAADNQKMDSAVLELRASLRFSSRREGKALSYLIENLANGRFFTLGSREYALLGFLDGKQSCRQAFNHYRQSTNQGEQQASTSQPLNWKQALRLFDFLIRENLLESVNGNTMNADHQESKGGWLQNIQPIGFRVRLFNADRAAKALNGKLGWLFGPWALAIWLVTLTWAFLLFWGNREKFFSDASLILEPGNWVYLCFCWVILKMIHETAHAVCCRAFGGSVGDAGIQFLLFLPMPFVDVSSSWRFESGRKRMGVALAGIYAELFVAALFVVVWSLSRHPVLGFVSVQVVTMASLTTLLFNINPLMKFDGYFVLSDLLKKPNLATQGARYQKNWVRQVFFGIRSGEDLSSVDWITRLYGWLAALWRVVVAVSLILAAANLFHGAGILLAAAAVFLWYVRPMLLFMREFVFTRSPMRISHFRCLATFLVFLVAIDLCTHIPWPFAPYAHGVVDFSRPQTVRAPADGFLTELMVSDGQPVHQGQVIGILENKELLFHFRSLKIDRQIAVIEAKKMKREKELASYQAVLRKIEKLDEQIEIIGSQADRLSLTAPCDGRIVAAELTDCHGAFFRQGQEILKIVPGDSVEIVSGIDEFHAPIFHQALQQPLTVALESGPKMTTTLKSIEPTAIRSAPHPALSAKNGGPLPVHPAPPSEGTEWELVNPVFRAHTASLQPTAKRMALPLVGQRCRIFLANRSHSIYEVASSKISSWFRDHWDAMPAKN